MIQLLVVDLLLGLLWSVDLLLLMVVDLLLGVGLLLVLWWRSGRCVRLVEPGAGAPYRGGGDRDWDGQAPWDQLVVG